MTDIDATVRAEAVKYTIQTATKDLSAVNEPTLQAVRERALDKKVLCSFSTRLSIFFASFQFAVRREALTSLAKLFRKTVDDSKMLSSEKMSLIWIPERLGTLTLETC